MIMLTWQLEALEGRLLVISSRFADFFLASAHTRSTRKGVQREIQVQRARC